MNIHKLVPGNFYHIYNRGINSCDLFKDANNYNHFLKLYDKYISPVANTYAWVLMPNHFHFLIYLKENIIYKYSKKEIDLFKMKNADRSKNAVWLGSDSVEIEINKWETEQKPDSVNDLSAFKIPDPKSHISHLFNAYTKYFNINHQRHGTLFERSFKRKLIDSDEYLRQAVIYIHCNPVHHSFVSHPIEYSWSSYETWLSEKKSKLKRKEVLRLFDDIENFTHCHQTVNEYKDEMFL